MESKSKSAYFILALCIVFMNVWSLNLRTETPLAYIEFYPTSMKDTSGVEPLSPLVPLDEEESRESSLTAESISSKTHKTDNRNVKYSKSSQKSAIQNINFNDTDWERLVKSGLDSKTANILLNFIDKGGKIRNEDDLNKIYTMEEAWIKKNASRFVFQKGKENSKSKYNRIEAKPFDINAADSITWVSLRGIGPYYAKKIMKYRDLLGGFYSADQVGETYGIQDSVFQTFKQLLYVHTPITQINLHTCTVEELAKHPYVRWKEAKVILSFVSQRPRAKDMKVLDTMYGIDKDRLSKMLPYFSLKTSVNGIAMEN